MRKDTRILRFGTRGSKLALVQWEQAVGMLKCILPAWEFEQVVLSTPGDRDHGIDLVDSAPDDFFTRDLDIAIQREKIDAAVHSAKDLPEKSMAGIDWVWLPQGDDPRDVLVYRKGETPEQIKAGGKIGVSSQRRKAYARQCFPHLNPAGIRGNVEERLAQLDAGQYDLLILAAAGLNRLGFADRIGRYLPLDELTPPPGQGHLALTFRSDDFILRALAALFVKPVVIAGAGSGHESLITLAAKNAMEQADVCLFDALLASEIFQYLPAHCRRIFAGKRSGNHAFAQDEINRQIVLHAKRGLRVVRLQGGDPGIFGRLAEELDALEAASLPYQIIPGVSSLNSATLSNGIVLTQRGLSNGFTVMSATIAGGATADGAASGRAKLPCVFFMGTEKIADIVSAWRADGVAENMPAAVFSGRADKSNECVRGTLATIAGDFKTSGIRPPALVLIGQPAALEHAYYSRVAPLAGMRILVTGSPRLNHAASAAIHDYGGVPVDFPLIELFYEPACEEAVRRMRDFDFVMLTSPSAPSFLARALKATGQDWRALPAVIVSGKQTAAALGEYGIRADLVPDVNFGTEGILNVISSVAPRVRRILKLTSALVDARLSSALAGLGAEVVDCVLYNNRPRVFTELPPCAAVLLASGSAFASLTRQVSRAELSAKMIVPIGKPTVKVMESSGLRPFVIPGEATAECAMAALATRLTAIKIEKLFDNQREETR